MSNYSKAIRRGASNEGTGWRPLYPLVVEAFAANPYRGLRWTVPTPQPIEYEIERDFEYMGRHWAATVPGHLNEWIDYTLVGGGDGTALYFVRPRWEEGNVAWSTEVIVEEMKSAP